MKALADFSILHDGFGALVSGHFCKNGGMVSPLGHGASGAQRCGGCLHAYNLKNQRDQERRWVEQAEVAHARFVASWKPRAPKAPTGAAKEERR
jgi:hypothetical protein